MALSTLQQQWIEKFSAWAISQADVRAVLLVGSQGRIDNQPAEAWSDMDVMLLVNKPALYAEESAWMGEIARLWAGVMSPEETFGGWVSVFCGFSVYEGGLNVDFLILSQNRVRWATRVMRLFERFPTLRRRVPENLVNLGLDAGDLLRQGARILVDKDGVAAQFQRAVLSNPVEAPAPPAQSKFEATVTDFWVDPTRIAADLGRGRLVEALRAINNHRKRLLKMIEWHARSQDHWQGDDLSFRLKSIEHWADKRALQALPLTYAGYDMDEAWSALLQIMELYLWLEAETAEALGYQCSFEAGERVRDWVRECFSENKA